MPRLSCSTVPPRAGLAVLLAVAAALVLSPPARAAEAVPESEQQIKLTFAPLIREAAPAVVNIYTTRQVRERQVSPLFDDPFFRRFFGRDFPFGPERERRQNALGSGVIVSGDGLVVTNHHVVENADSIKVVLNDRTEYAAETVLSDERTDLAVLRIADAGDRSLPALDLAAPDSLAVGDLVLAIGNPFGVGQTVTMGIVSALARTSVGISDYSFFIQTDAAINPGNSGGALVDIHGDLVGINTAIFSRDGGSLGIGFAVPVDMVRAVVHAAETGRPLVRPWLGASGQGITAEIAEGLGLDRPAGVLVNAIHPGGPAATAGLDVGDVIVALDGRRVDDPEALRYRIATLTPGDEAVLSILRDGRPRDLTFPVALPPDEPPRDETVIEGRTPLAGATVANLNPALAQELGLQPPAEPEVVVLSVARGAPAARVGLRPGDRIVALDRRAIGSVAALGDALDGSGPPWRLTIRRDGRDLTSVIGG
ncbi:MAG: Do family serine endopeptidase [Azospirillaceae bacterium]